MTGIGGRIPPLLALGLFLLAPGRLGAQQRCPQVAIATPPGDAWTPPLDRPVTLESSSLSLREALDRVAAVGRFRLSYSSEALALDRQVCLSAQAEPAGQLLLELTGGTSLHPVVAAADHVVLAPVADAPETAPSAINTRAVPLETIVVTGSATGASRRPLPVALDVVSGEDLRALNSTTLSAALSGTVPGMWIWTQSPASVLAGYASIRGASSFGLSYPKVYIDGIEVANPLVVTGIEPDAIDRIEVIRGPQGAALYGADAISGVMNIVTRQDGADPDVPRVSLQSQVGLASTEFGTSPAVEQRHSLALRLGSNLRSASLHLAAGTSGSFIPEASDRHLSAQGSLRAVGARTLWTGILRVAADRASAPASPLLPDSLLRPALQGVRSQSVLGYTAGTTFKLIPSERWTHSLMVGIDGYTLDGVADDRAPITSAADSALRAADGGAVRGTIRIGTLRRIGLGRSGSADLALSAEHSTLHQWSAHDSTDLTRGNPAWRNTGGISAVGNLELGQRVFLSGGARVERTTDNDPELVPMVGTALVQNLGRATLKVRGSYGRGIRWPSTPARRTLWGNGDALLIPGSLEPEQQSGIEAGLDLLIGEIFTAGVTRFDQTASGLIQRVAVAIDSAPGPGQGQQGRRIAYQYENVGEIGNSGWELAATVSRGGFSLAGTFSFVDSRVERVADRYRGDLQTGDRMLEVPARTMSLTARWRDSRWSLAVAASRAEDWVNYDRLALAEAFAQGGPGRGFTGAELRNYWKVYPGVTRLRASASRLLGRDFRITLSGENLLNEQQGEPDNLTVLPGRTLSLGLWAGL